MRVILTRHPDSAGNSNRGWRDDHLSMTVDGMDAGYITLSYIPFHRILQWYGEPAAQTALEFAAGARGTTVARLLKRGERLGLPPTIEWDKLHQLWRRLDCARVLKRGGDVSFEVDRPLVAFSRVYTAGEDYQRHEDRTRWVSSVPPLIRTAQADFRKKGLGLLLYVEGARWMAEQGMLLHGDRGAKPEAKRAWDVLRDTFPGAVTNVIDAASKEEHRRLRITLDGSSLPSSWKPRDVMEVTVRSMPSGRLADTYNLDELLATAEESSDYRNYLLAEEAEAHRAGRPPLGGEPMPSAAQALKDFRNRALAQCRPDVEDNKTVPSEPALAAGPRR